MAFDDTVTVDQDSTANDVTSAILANDTDTEGDSLSVAARDNATGGSVDVTGGVVTFTPTADECGTGEGGFDYVVDDGNGGTDTGHVTVDVNCELNVAPVANDDTVPATEDTDAVIAGGDLTGNDTDGNGDALTVNAVSNPTGGTVDVTAGTVTFTPTADLCGDGAGSFDYLVVDGNGGSDTGHVTVDITCVDDAPVANDDSVTVAQDSSANDVTATLLDNDTDPEHDTLSVSGIASDAGGTADLARGRRDLHPGRRRVRRWRRLVRLHGQRRQRWHRRRPRRRSTSPAPPTRRPSPRTTPSPATRTPTSS